MQISTLRPALLLAVAGASLEDIGGRGPSRSQVVGALMAPVAMAAGALGLLGLWTVSTAPGFAPLPAAGAARPAQVAAVETAAVRHGQDLSRLLVRLGAPEAVAAAPTVSITQTPAQAVAALRSAEAGMVSAADQDAKTRLAAAGRTLRGAGLDARVYMDPAKPAQELSPLELRDARVMAARFDVDPALARQVQATAKDLIAAGAMADAAADMPQAVPVVDPVRSSPFGERIDPFTHARSFHPGEDFKGRYGEDVHVTAPGVVSFVGWRGGYGNCVEVDHGHGFKTRYGHLSAFASWVGRPVKTGDVIARMGSTGRSTGVHLHYEVWASGRLLDPVRFLPAGIRQG